MKNKHFAALLLAAATLMAVGCTEKENHDGQAHVTTIYRSMAITAEMFNPATSSWDTLTNLPAVRSRLCDIRWDGDRIDSVLAAGDTTVFVYDDQGRLVTTQSGVELFYIYYDADGRIANYAGYMSLVGGGYGAWDTFACNYEAGRLAEVRRTALAEVVNQTTVIYRYTYQGDNVKQLQVITSHQSGTNDTVVLNYEFTSYANLLRGLPYFTYPGLGLPMLFSNDTYEGVNANWISGYTTADGEVKCIRDYTLRDGRVATCTEEAITTRTMARARSVTILELEYDK